MNKYFYYLASVLLFTPTFAFPVDVGGHYCVNFTKVISATDQCPYAVGGYRATQLLDRHIERFVSTVGDGRFIYDGSVALPSNSELIRLNAWGMFVAKDKHSIKFSESIAKEPRRDTDKYDPAMRGWVVIPTLHCKMQYVTSHTCPK